jgi:hypothetical protein
MNPDQDDIDQQDDQDDEIDLATVDWSERRDLTGDAAYFLRKEADREHARGTLADTIESAGAHYTESKALEARAKDLEDNAWDTSSLDPADRTQLQDVAPGLVDEIQRREAVAAAEQAELERIEAMTEEQRAAEAAAEARDAEEQAREDALQALMDETDAALNAPDPYAVPRRVTIFADAEGGARMTSVEEGEGDDITHTEGLGPAGHPETPYHRAVRERVGMFGVMQLANEVRDLPPAARAAFWAARSQVELDALERGFGLRPAASGREIRAALEGGA